jgi:predicted CopG family antitoxin
LPELAYKRIPVTEQIWKDLSKMKEPGESYTHLLEKMIALKQESDFRLHLEMIEKTGRFVSLEEAAKRLEIKPDEV